MPVVKYHNGTTWTEVSTAGSAGPTGPTGPAADITALVEKSGDTMVGPLYIPEPTELVQAPRWADAVPRFADAAERDAAYATIGGPVPGMECYQNDVGALMVFGSTLTWGPVAHGQTFVFQRRDVAEVGGSGALVPFTVPLVITAAPPGAYVTGCNGEYAFEIAGFNPIEFSLLFNTPTGIVTPIWRNDYDDIYLEVTGVTFAFNHLGGDISLEWRAINYSSISPVHVGANSTSWLARVSG